jgi:hypothetical protein
MPSVVGPVWNKFLGSFAEVSEGVSAVRFFEREIVNSVAMFDGPAEGVTPRPISVLDGVSVEGRNRVTFQFQKTLVRDNLDIENSNFQYLFGLNYVVEGGDFSPSEKPMNLEDWIYGRASKPDTIETWGVFPLVVRFWGQPKNQTKWGILDTVQLAHADDFVTVETNGVGRIFVQIIGWFGYSSVQVLCCNCSGTAGYPGSELNGAIIQFSGDKNIPEILAAVLGGSAMPQDSSCRMALAHLVSANLSSLSEPMVAMFQGCYQYCLDLSHSVTLMQGVSVREWADNFNAAKIPEMWSVTRLKLLATWGNSAACEARIDDVLQLDGNVFMKYGPDPSSTDFMDVTQLCARILCSPFANADEYNEELFSGIQGYAQTRDWLQAEINDAAYEDRRPWTMAIIRTQMLRHENGLKLCIPAISLFEGGSMSGEGVGSILRPPQP